MENENVPLVAKLRDQVAKGRLADDVAVVYRRSGGSGEENVDESVAVTASGSLHVRIRDPFAARPQGEARDEIARETVLGLFRELLRGVENMVPASQARFLPDTVVSSVSFAAGNERETFYFAADEDDAEHRGQPITPQIRSVLERFRQIEASCLSDEGRGHHGGGEAT
jgi:hypothetical protein